MPDNHTPQHRPQDFFARLELPAQDMTSLTFCAGNKAARVQEWVNQLPATRFSQTSTQLYKHLPELCRLKTDAKTRLDMLEAVRTRVHNTIEGLAGQFLGQSLILPEEAQKAAIVAQALQKMMTDGYTLCVRDILNQKARNKQLHEQLALAIYRACFSIGALYLRSCQIYSHLPKGLWLQLHQLFQLAGHLELDATPVPDPLLQQRKAATIKECYLRTLLLACSRANQLSQQDLQLAYDAYETWAGQVNLKDEVKGTLFVVPMAADEPPGYRARFNHVPASELVELDFSGLISIIDPQKSRHESSAPPELIRHLMKTWQAAPDRQQHRHQVKTVVDVCVGISECHYHLADKKTFASFMGRSGRPNPSDWHELPDYSARGVTPGDRKNAQGDPAYTPTRVNVQNISAGGYCLYWRNDMPSHASAGQLLGIREAGQKEWHLGVARWVRQLRGASQMGVQVLAMHAEPAAASLIYELGGYSDAMRVLQVPANGAMPATLVTAAAPFQEHSRVRLVNDKRTITLTLGEIVFATNKLRQFTYQVTGAESEASAAPTPSADSEFDSKWD